MVNKALLRYPANMDISNRTSAYHKGQFSLVHLANVFPSRNLLLVETKSRESEGITELVSALALRFPLYIIAGGEWLPGYVLTRSVRRRTPEVKQILDRIHLARPFTCYQILDLLSETRPGNEPILILDFLHHFHNEDVELPVRFRVFEQCCKHLERLSLFRPVLTFVQHRPVEEYQQLFPFLISIADQIFQMDGEAATEVSQLVLF